MKQYKCNVCSHIQNNYDICEVCKVEGIENFTEIELNNEDDEQTINDNQ